MKILYIEDDPAHIELTQRSLESHEAKFDLQTAESVEAANPLLDKTEYDVILTDHLLPDGSGLDVLRIVREKGLSAAVVLITNQGDTNTAVAALKAGAVDYVVKQSDYLHKLPIVLINAQIKTQLAKQQLALRKSEQKYRSMYATAERQAQELTLLDKVRTALARELDLSALITLVVDSIATTFGYTLVSLYLIVEDRLILQYQVGHDKVISEIKLTEGVAGEVVRTRKPTLFEDVREAAHFLGAIDNIVSEICIPLFDEEQVVGILNVESTHGVKLSGADLHLMSALGEHISVALKRARLYTQLQNELNERKAAEAALRESESRYRNIFENSLEGIFQSLHGDRFASVNPAMARIYGYNTPTDMMQGIHSISRQLHVDPESRKRFVDLLMKNGAVDGFEAQNLRKDGSIIWTSTNARAVRDDNGQVLYFEGFLTDITARKQAELAREESERKYRSLVERFPAVVYLDDFYNETNQYMSPRLKDLLGYTPDEWAAGGHLWENSLHPDDRERVLAEDKLTNESGKPFQIEYRLRRKDGRYVWIREDSYLISDPHGNPLYWQGILLDITSQKEAEQAILHGEERFTSVFYSSPIAICITTWNEGIFIEANPAYWELSGYQPEEILGRSIVELGLISSDDRAKFLAHLHTDKSIKAVDEIFPDKSGNMHDVLSFYETIELGELKCVLSMFHDVTEQKKIQEAIRVSESSYRGLFDSVTQAIYIQDRQGRFLDVNKGALAMYGYPREFFIGKTPEALSAPGKNNLQELSGSIERAFCGEPQEFDFWGIRSDGEIFPKVVSLNKGTYFGQDAIIAIAQDITVRKQAEEVLERQLEELTVLHAASVAGIQGNSEDEIIEKTTQITAGIYTEVCGILLLNNQQDILTPHSSCIGPDASNWQVGYPISDGITGQCVREGKSLRIDDVAKEQNYIEIASGIRSELCVPIRVHNNIIGVLDVESRQPHAFDEKDERLLNTIAAGLGNAVERLRLFKAQERQLQREAALLSLMRATASSPDLDDVLQSILDQLINIIPSDCGTIQLLKQKQLRIVAAIGKEALAFAQRGTLEIDDYPLNKVVIFEKHPIRIDDTTREARYRSTPETAKIRSFLAIPLISKEAAIGMITLNSYRTNHFTDQHEELALAIADHATIAIENARLFQETVRRAQEAAAIAEVGRDISTMLQLNPVLERIAHYAKELLRAETSAVYLIDALGTGLRAIASIGIDSEEIKNDPLQVGIGILGNIAKQRFGEIVNDTVSDPRAITIKGTTQNPLEHIMGVPVLSKDQLTGLLVVWRTGEEEVFVPSELEFLSSLAQQAAVAIENARLFEAEQNRRKEAENLRQAASAVTSSLDLNHTVKEILNALKRVAPHDSASVFLQEGEALRLAIAEGYPDSESMTNTLFPIDDLYREMTNAARPLILHDAQKDERFRGRGSTAHIHGWMAIPLIARGEVIGGITLDSLQAGTYNESMGELALVFAHQASVAIENARLYAETRRRLDEQQVISRISFSLRVAKNIREMLPLLLKEIQKAMDTDTASIWLYDSDKNELIQSAAQGWLTQIPKPNFKPSEGIVGYVYSNSKVHISSQFLADPIADPNNTKAFGKDWGGVAIPIRTTAETIGTLVVALPTNRPIERHHVQLLSTIAEIAGNAIQRSSLFEQSEKQVQRLTALREIDTAIASSFDLRVTLNIVANHIMAQSNANAVDILNYSADQLTLNCITSTGFRSTTIMQTVLRLGEDLAGQALLERKDIFVEDLANEKSFLRKSLLVQEGFASYCAIPLVSKGVAKGVLEIYFRQPFAANSDWIEFLHIMAGQATIAIDNASLFENLQRSNQELTLAYDTTLEGWGKALELRDKETQGHTRRVTDKTLELARQMGIPESELKQIRRGVLLHDIGKMGIPDTILHKKGNLTKKEWEIMRKHPQYAYDLLSSISYLRPVLDIPYCHHEWWDGTGYPRGLKGESIPLAARIFAVVDVWDALLSERPYREAWQRPRVIKYIKEQSGSQFDPEVVKAFLQMITTDKYQESR